MATESTKYSLAELDKKADEALNNNDMKKYLLIHQLQNEIVYAASDSKNKPSTPPTQKSQ